MRVVIIHPKEETHRDKFLLHVNAAQKARTFQVFLQWTLHSLGYFTALTQKPELNLIQQLNPVPNRRSRAGLQMRQAANIGRRDNFRLARL